MQKVCETGVAYLPPYISLCVIALGNYVITYDMFPKSSADLSSFKSGIADGSSGSKTAMDLYRSFATRSKAIESMHGTYEIV